MELKDEYGKIEQLFSVKNQVVLITGAGGLAEMYAYGFAKNGAIIVLASKTRAKAEAVCSRLKEAGYPCMALEVQIEKKDQVKRAVQTILDTYGKLISASTRQRCVCVIIH